MAEDETTVIEAETQDDEPEEEDAQAALYEAAQEEPDQVFLTNLRWGPEKTIPQLTAALAKATLEFGEVKKSSENPFYKSSYADLAELISATRSPLAKYGVVVVQFPGITNQGAVVTSLLFHTSGEWLGGDLPLPTARKDAQGLGSGMTFARRYTYGPLLNLAGEIDDDGNAAIASRKEHLARLNPKMESQERIMQVSVTAFNEACKKSGKTQAEIEEFLKKLNDYRQVEDIKKGEWNAAIKWAAAPKKPKEDLTEDLKTTLQQVNENRFAKVYATAKEHHVSNTDLHQWVKEQYHVDHMTDLSGEELHKVIKWVEAQK